MIRKQSSALLDLGALVLLLLLPLLLFAPVALGSRTLLPADALFLDEPYRTAATNLGADFPHNHLVVDLILENYAWKHFLVEAIHNREVPLWDPYIFAGHPFLANGQHSAFYPLSLVFYVLPLWRAYGIFAWLQLGLAGIFAYLFARVLGIRRLGALIAGITFQFSGFMITSSVPHPMIIAAASWLPFVLAMVELIVQQRPALGQRPATLPWALLGALGLGCQMLAGHVENTYFTLLVVGAYVLWRLIVQPTDKLPDKNPFASWLLGRQRPIFWIVIMLVLGLALGAVQFVPLYEVVDGSFRSGEAAASLDQVLGWAYPARRLITFGVPNFFGSPAHHDHFDLFEWRTVPVTANLNGEPILHHEWGIKNYVEGGAYLGLLPLFLAIIGVLAWIAPRVSRITPNTKHSARYAIPFFTLLSLFSLGCIFGTPLYALVYVLPGLEQSHSPFRWIFPLTFAIAVLAGFGVEAVTKSRNRLQEAGNKNQKAGKRLWSPISDTFLLKSSFSLTTLFAGLAFWGGVTTLVGLILSRVFFAQIELLVERVFLSLAKAPTAFLDHRAFYSYEFKWIALFGLLLTGTGIVLRVSRCPIFIRRRPAWEFLAVGLLVLDFVTFGMGFGPAADPALLDYVPPVVEFLRQDTSIWRYANFTPPGTTKTMNANVGMFYNLQYVAGYDSLFTRQYTDYLSLIEEQTETQYNRIASFSEWSSLDSPLTDLLNVKYVVTEIEIPNPKYQLVYQDDAVRVYENLGVMPRAYTMPSVAAMETDNLAATVQDYDPRNYVILDTGAYPLDFAPQSSTATGQTVMRYTINEVEIDVQIGEPGWLILADAYFPDWKAYIRPQGMGADAETQISIYRVNGTFRGVRLEEPGSWTVRFKYSPNSVKIGAFISFIAGMLVLFLVGLYLWRFFYREEDDASTVRRVAKNSIAPIILNLFNQAINFAFVALMARILGPEGTGRYDLAVAIFVWFGIITEFGLDMYLMREAARDRSNARRVFANTTVLRLLLFVAAIPLLVSFLASRQAWGEPLAAETVWALVLLYAGLLFSSLANGLAALFRACEKHEYPAAIQTVTITFQVTLGVLVLVGGLGITGLAGTTILTNLATLAILTILARRMIWNELPSAQGGPVWRQQRAILVENWSLMTSLLLQSLFPGVNALMLQQLQGAQGDIALGWYSSARKWVDALNIVPQFFTMAVFPVVSRLATEDREGLRRSYRLSVKLLTMVALPVAVLTTLVATTLVGMLSGHEFLPHGAVTLQILIWSIIFGWTNSLTNYVLIALNRQRYVMVTSGARVIFTVIANLLFVGAFGYVASAWILVSGELLLAMLFYADLRRQLGPMGWGRTLGRTVVAGLAMGATVWTLTAYSFLLALLASLIVYPVALLLLRAIIPEEWAMLSPLLPARLRKIVPV
ncbi:MAG: oligosaccharide flippase family protein [Chloroflexi bacterium]|nr:oligosaccharide flippase family protein [Chloroflexota bacterium]